MKKLTLDDLASLAIAQKAAEALRTPGSDYRNPYLATSDNSDAYTIGAWCAYHHGAAPLYVHKSRGHSWNVETQNFQRLTVEVRKADDHRDGVRVIAEGAR